MEILQFTYIYSRSYVYSGRYSWISYRLLLADFLAHLYAFLSGLHSFFILINFVLRQAIYIYSSKHLLNHVALMLL
jgi:hypothetical protein